jgi:dihydroorotate dehydrogenase electron transfer subunit
LTNSELCPVENVEQVSENIFVLSFQSHRIASTTLPGQFVNIKPDASIDPLLRRPFSVYYTSGDSVQIVFNVIGKGTSVLGHKRRGDTVDVLGPLGVPFKLNSQDYETAVLVGGGLGIAPLPMTTGALKRLGKKIETYIGSRTSSFIVDRHLESVHIATDDGSRGFHGNVVELLSRDLPGLGTEPFKIFACGPTKMLQVLQSFVLAHGLKCEASLEGPMGCGFGICQGCPVELKVGERKYALMCKDGPTFDIQKIRL